MFLVKGETHKEVSDGAAEEAAQLFLGHLCPSSMFSSAKPHYSFFQLLPFQSCESEEISGAMGANHVTMENVQT